MRAMTARYPGRCASTGRPINPGDPILYDPRTRRAHLQNARAYQSDIFTIDGREYYRNKAGRCEDAPCCGCCTI